MTILTHYAGDTYKAQIRSDRKTGFTLLYTGSCTAGPQHAARNLVEKYFGPASAQSVRQLKDPAQIHELTGGWHLAPSRKHPFDIWTFIP